MTAIADTLPTIPIVPPWVSMSFSYRYDGTGAVREFGKDERGSAVGHGCQERFRDRVAYRPPFACRGPLPAALAALGAACFGPDWAPGFVVFAAPVPACDGLSVLTPAALVSATEERCAAPRPSFDATGVTLPSIGFGCARSRARAVGAATIDDLASMAVEAFPVVTQIGR